MTRNAFEHDLKNNTMLETVLAAVADSFRPPGLSDMGGRGRELKHRSLTSFRM